MKSAEVLQSVWHHTKKPAVVVATGALAIACSGGSEAKQDTTTSPTTPSSTRPSRQVTLPPTGDYDHTDWQIIACYTKSVKIRPGNTVFGLTTNGLEPTETFKNRVFSWNLDEIQKQAETKSALSDPNNIPIGTKFNILTDCVSVSQAIPDYEWDKDGDMHTVGYSRVAEFQNYNGTDGVTRHLVSVLYESDKQGNFYHPKSNEVYDVIACEPAPECYNYVGSAPEKHLKYPYIPTIG